MSNMIDKYMDGLFKDGATMEMVRGTDHAVGDIMAAIMSE